LQRKLEVQTIYNSLLFAGMVRTLTVCKIYLFRTSVEKGSLLANELLVAGRGGGTVGFGTTGGKFAVAVGAGAGEAAVDCTAGTGKLGLIIP
jgi:hypothetical protein